MEYITTLGEGSSDEPFCHTMRNGGGMIMYMDGFRRSLHGPHPCLNLFHPSWTLDSREKFMIATFGIFVMAMAVEAMSKLRRRVVLIAQAAIEANDHPNSNSNNNKWSPSMLRVVVTCIHGAQALVGYLLMLATMTFSVELFLAVVLGLATGYAILFRHQEALNEHHVTSNPCCNFMEGEAQESDDVNDSETRSPSTISAETPHEPESNNTDPETQALTSESSQQQSTLPI